jgi:hypothetical protein
MVRLDARLHWQRQHEATHRMTMRERLAATWYALRECGDALYGAMRGWR